MEQICGIYKITNKINGHLYIGKSKDIYRRWTQHKSDAKLQRTNAPIHKAMYKYGIDNFLFEIIEKIPISQYNEMGGAREKYWISYYNSFKDKKHYNLTEGGEGMCGYSPTLKTKQKISISMKTWYKTPEGQARRKKQVEIAQNNASARTGWKHSEEWKQQHSRDMQGNKNPMFGKHSNGKPVYCIELNKTFPSARSAAKELGINAQGIGKACKGEYKQSGGYHWKWG